MENHSSFLQRLALTLFSLIALGYIIVVGKSIIAPFFLALLLALLFLPLNIFMEQKMRMKRVIATFFSFFIMSFVIYVMSLFFGSQLASFGKDLPLLEERFSGLVDDFQLWIDRVFGVNAETQIDYLHEGLMKLLSSSGDILGMTLNIFSTSFIFLFFTAIFFIFILLYRRTLSRFITHVFHKKHHVKVARIISDVKKMSKKYLLGLLLQVAIVSILTSVSLAIMGVKYAVLLGVLTGILNVVPYLGIIVSGMIAMLFALATATPYTSLYVLIAYTIVHIIDGNLVLPIIVGSIVKLNALVIFIGILIGAMLWGVAGMFFCIPTLAILRIIFKEVDTLKPWGDLLGE